MTMDETWIHHFNPEKKQHTLGTLNFVGVSDEANYGETITGSYYADQ